MTRNIPSGSMPDCQKCGECFDNWDRILTGRFNYTSTCLIIPTRVKREYL